MKKTLLIALFSTTLFASCTKDKNDDNPIVVNDYLVTATQKSAVTKEILQYAVNQAGFSAYANLPQVGVSAYAASYKTQYPRGTSVVASGAIFVPTNIDPAMPTVVYTHGTLIQSETPSVVIASPLTYTREVFFSALIASAFRCVVLMPDYIGYGASANITHPYIHNESLAQAGYDLMHTYREFAAGANLTFNPRMLITGYSEGGYAAVALQKRIQETYGTSFVVDKTVAGSGPYDNVAFAHAFLSKTTDCDPYEVSSYLWAMGMLKADYGYSKPYSDIFTTANNAKLEANGYQLGYFYPAELKIDSNPTQLFNPQFITEALNGTDTEFNNALEQNTLVNFTPTDSLIFVCGLQDTWVYPVNTINAYTAMKNKGCKVRKCEDPNGTHASTIVLYLDVLLNSIREIQGRN